MHQRGQMKGFPVFENAELPRHGFGFLRLLSGIGCFDPKIRKAGDFTGPK